MVERKSSHQLPWLNRTSYGRLVVPASDVGMYALGHLFRCVEMSFLAMFDKGQLSGTVHTCIGQELCALGVLRALDHPEDRVFSTHRNHGHFLAYCGMVEELMAEVLGKAGGVCGGRGGSQHVAFGRFHSSGVQGGLTGIAVGSALAMRSGTGMVVVFIGDGTLGEGLVYESMNLSAVWRVPVLFVIEDNGIAQTTPTSQTTAGSMVGRGSAMGLSSWDVPDDARDYLRRVEEAVAQVRASRTPGFLVIRTCRVGPHSKGDDTRSPEDRQACRERDALMKLANSLTAEQRASVEAANQAYVAGLVVNLLAREDATLTSTAFYRETKRWQRGDIPALSAVGSGTVAQEINGALRQLLVSCPEAVLVGEDLHDPYGGAFKITKGLSTDFPDRVLSSPISEAGIVGAAIGLSMEGHRPVVEIMFADFLLLCMDQIYNHAVKIPWVYPVGCLPLVIRSPGGGNRGYGPTHSQCVEDVFCQVPGLTVVAPSHRHDVGGLLTRAVLFWPYPTLFVEDKLLYGQKRDQGRYEVLAVRAQEWPHDLFPTLVRPAGPDPDLTCVAYGGQLPLVEAVADSLASEEEIQVEVIVPSLLSPLPVDSVVGHLCRRRRILVVQGTPGCGGFGAELLAELAAKGFRGRAARSGAARTPIPASRAAERQVLPQFDSVREAALALFSEKSGDHG